MKFKIGDQVSFLNEKGSGVVSKIINKNTVGVTIEDGFEIPFSVTELFEVKEWEEPEKVTPKEEKNAPIVYKPKVKVLTNKEQKGIYLAFSPEQVNDISFSSFNVWLINNTNYEILFTFSLFQNGDYITLQTGSAEKAEKLLIETINHQLLNGYSGFKLDVLFYNMEEHDFQQPLSEVVKMKPVKFYKENTFKENNFIQEKAMIVAIPLGEQIHYSEDIVSKINDSFSNKKYNVPSYQKADKLRNQEMEVDLHIEELLDDYSGMSNYEMMQVQLNAFQQALDEAIQQHCKKLIVIHGVGTGKLKTEIRNLLATFSNVTYYDAPLARYGFGATTVEIRHSGK